MRGDIASAVILTGNSQWRLEVYEAPSQFTVRIWMEETPICLSRRISFCERLKPVDGRARQIRRGVFIDLKELMQLPIGAPVGHLD